MNVLFEETDERRNLIFRLRTGYTNTCVNDKAETIAFQYINYVIDKYTKNPEKCKRPITLGLYKEYINRWRGSLFGYFIPTQRTSQNIWITSQVWNNKVRGFKLRKDTWGNEYILTKFGKIYAYDYLPAPINQLEQSYKEMQDLMKRQLDYIVDRGHLEEYNYVYLPGHIKVTSVEELRNYYGGIAKSFGTY